MELDNQPMSTVKRTVVRQLPTGQVRETGLPVAWLPQWTCAGAEKRLLTGLLFTGTGTIPGASDQELQTRRLSAFSRRVQTITHSPSTQKPAVFRSATLCAF